MMVNELGVHLTLPKVSENFTFNVMAQIMDMHDEVIYDAVLNYAKQEGITDLYLIDKEFVKTALINEAERRKMTDEQIIKGLECCQTQYERKCKQGCPYMQFQKNYISADTCSSRLRADLLALVIRQKEEIERLKK